MRNLKNRWLRAYKVFTRPDVSRVSYGIKEGKVDGPKKNGNAFNGAFGPRLPDVFGLNAESNDATKFPTRKHVVDVRRYLGTSTSLEQDPNPEDDLSYRLLMKSSFQDTRLRQGRTC